MADAIVDAFVALLRIEPRLSAPIIPIWAPVLDSLPD